MKDIIYILEYYSLKYIIDRNVNGDYFLDTCGIINHHYLSFNSNGKCIGLDRKDCYQMILLIVKCKYRLK